MHPIRASQPCHGKELQRSLQPNTISQTQENTLDKLMQECLPCTLHVTCARRLLFSFIAASASGSCRHHFLANLCWSLFCRSTCKADLSSHLGCSRLSQCCFLTCKPLACPRSMQVYRYSSQKSTEQHKCKDLQRTLHPIRPYPTQSNFEVRRCRVSVLNL